jgi:hypothetical protein
VKIHGLVRRNANFLRDRERFPSIFSMGKESEADLPSRNLRPRLYRVSVPLDEHARCQRLSNLLGPFREMGSQHLVVAFTERRGRKIRANIDQ